MYQILTFNIPINQRYLVEKKEPTDNDLGWYNLYSDGWCEQGGQVTNADSQTVILEKQYANTNYSVMATQGETGKYGSYSITVGARTTTSFPIYISYNHTDVKTMWRACGYTPIIKGKSIIKY